MKSFLPVACTALLSYSFSPANAQSLPPASPEKASAEVRTAGTLSTINVSADASADGLSPALPGGQVARGGRAGILGTHDNLSTPVSITSYTNELIQDRQARSVGDVLQNDAGVRIARGFGNFQESYFMRGFILNSDDVAYNGMYGLLPRQYIATELFERVEVLRGASAFLNGANPGGGGIGGAVNLLPKRAGNEPLTRVTVGAGTGTYGSVSTDISRRFGPDNSTGIRVNAAYRDGGTAVDQEKAKLGLASVGLDWHNRDVRLSADIGYQNNRLKNTRPNVTLFGATAVPATPDSANNFAQPWTYSNERDTFGTLRGEFDLNKETTAWVAYGMRRSKEANSLANPNVASANGDATFYRFDNTREDKVDTGEIGLRGKLRTGKIGHEWVASYSAFQLDKRSAYTYDFLNAFATNIYSPVSYAQPAFSVGAVSGNNLASPARTGKLRLSSLALGDTLSMLDESLLITIGARYQKLDNSTFADNTGVETNYNKTRTSPMAGVVYKLNKEFSLYGNYVEGLTPGEIAPVPFSGTAPVNVGQALAPYVSKQKEIGFKYQGGRLGGGVALFSTTKPRSFTNAANVFTSEGEDRHRGAELNMYGQIMRGFKVLGGVTWLDAKQSNTGNATTTGKRVIGVPRTQANLGAEMDVPGVQGLALDARVVYTGSSYADATNTLKVPSWTRLDLGARWMFNLQGKLATVRLRVDNATNRNYWGSVGGYPDNGYLVVGAPRSVVLSGSIDF